MEKGCPHFTFKEKRNSGKSQLNEYNQWYNAKTKHVFFIYISQNDALTELRKISIVKKQTKKKFTNSLHLENPGFTLSLERRTLASSVPLFLLGYFLTNECQILDFCL